MLQRIISIKNVGRFHNCNAAGDVTFRQITLVFAENGRGKTTFCAILRSLAENRPDLVLGRRTLGENNEPQVKLLIKGQNIDFRNSQWNEVHPELCIFDGTYIGQNVFAGDIVDTTNRRNMYNVIIGRQGVDLARRISAIDGDVRSTNTDIRNNRDAIARLLPSTVGVEQFIALSNDVDIDAKISAKERELVVAQRATTVQQGRSLESIELPAYPSSVAEIFGATLTGVPRDAEKTVASHVARHRMAERGLTWLAEGVGYVAHDECPFCAQSIRGSDLVAAYTAYFGENYRTFKENIVALQRQIETLFCDRVSDSLAHVVARNNDAVEFWREYRAFDALPPLQVEEIRGVVNTLRLVSTDLLARKAQFPLEPLAPGEEYSTAVAGLDELRAKVARYNESAAAVNALIGATKSEAGLADADKVQNDLNLLLATKLRSRDDARELCEIDAAHAQRRQALDNEKTELKGLLDEHTVAVIAHYGQSINRYLNRLNAGFTITQPAHNYRGGAPNTSYQIVINDTTVQLGDADTPLDQASFKNTLSSGDRGSLALAFFFAQLECEPDRAYKIVVFDDPFTSLDAFRRSQTVNQIVRCVPASTQVILLSHEPYFLKLVWDRASTLDRKTLQMARAGKHNTNIVEWDINEAVQDSYLTDFYDLRRYYDDNEGGARDVVKKIRPVLEGYCRRVCPGEFAENDALGKMIEKVRDVGELHHLAGILADLEDINDFSRRHHHAETVAGPNPVPDDNELQHFVSMTLDIVGGGL